MKRHLQRVMPLFLTLRAETGNPLAMLPQATFDPSRCVLGRGNTDPYMRYADAILALSKHLQCSDVIDGAASSLSLRS